MADITATEVYSLFSQAITQNDTGKIFLLIGIFLLLLGCFAIYKAIGAEPESIGGFQKVLMSLCCAAGTIFIILGSAIGFVTAWKMENGQKYVKEIITPEQSFARLKNNDRVSWLIRLIPHKESDDSLNLGKLKTIGRSGQRFTFVADYDELRGRSAADAVRMIGLDFEDFDKVSAIIFPVASQKIYPVNARGLLQIIAKVDKNLDEKDKFRIAGRLQNDDFEALNLDKLRENPSSYGWENYKSHYTQYCQIVQTFRCSGKTTIAAFIGDITEDWHPLGFSRKKPLGSIDVCKQTNQLCNISDWNSAHKDLIDSFGARVFLMDNVEISSLRSRILIDFNDPRSEKIPYLYLDTNSDKNDNLIKTAD